MKPIEDSQDRRQKLQDRMRRTYNIGMGTIIFVVGILSFTGIKFGSYDISITDATMRWMFGSLCLLYGAFRVYRGFTEY